MLVTQTPALDALVAEGIELTRFYAFKYCSPSRSAFSPPNRSRSSPASAPPIFATSNRMNRSRWSAPLSAYRTRTVSAE